MKSYKKMFLIGFIISFLFSLEINSETIHDLIKSNKINEVINDPAVRNLLTELDARVIDVEEN